MTTPSRLLRLLVLTAAVACSSATAPSGDVTAVATDAGIRMANGTDRPIFFTRLVRQPMSGTLAVTR